MEEDSDDETEISASEIPSHLQNLTTETYEYLSSNQLEKALVTLNQ